MELGDSDLKRFWSKVQKTQTCWNWTAGRWGKGYGYFYLSGKDRRAHIVSYVMHKGPIPENLEVDHVCENRGCVNPDHLEAVTHKANIRRAHGGLHDPETHCPSGHEFTEENTYLYPSTGTRKCRRCRADQQLAYKKRKSAQ